MELSEIRVKMIALTAAGERLRAKVLRRLGEFVVQLRAEHVRAIDAAVRASTVIVRKMKKSILAGYG